MYEKFNKKYNVRKLIISIKNRKKSDSELSNTQIEYILYILYI